MGSAIAFRLFLFFVPLLLLVVGIAGFVSGFVAAGTVSRTAGLYAQSAGDQRGFSPAWVHTVVCAVRPVRGGDGRPVIEQGLAGSQRSRVAGCRCRDPGPRCARPGGWPAICGMTLIAILVNRVREDLGLGLAGLAFVPALVIYGLAWLGVSMMLPRATQDPGALLPGRLAGRDNHGHHAVSELYLPDRLSRASQLYGAIGATVGDVGVVHSRERNRAGHGAERGNLRAVREHFPGRVLAPVFPGPGPQVRARAQILRTPVNRVADRAAAGAGRRSNPRPEARHCLCLPRRPAAHRESDLLAFDTAIERSHPVGDQGLQQVGHGDYAGGNAPLINDVLKDTWGIGAGDVRLGRNPGLGVRALRARPGKRRPTRRDRVQGGAIRRTAQAA